MLSRSALKRAPQAFRLSSGASSSFLAGSNGAYAEEMYRRWNEDPSSVHASWDALFRTGEYQAPPTIAPAAEPTQLGAGAAAGAASPQQMRDVVNLYQLIRNYQVRGHYLASLDPLGLANHEGDAPVSLTLEGNGFTEADLDRQFPLGMSKQQSGFMGKAFAGRSHATLREILEVVRETYCGSIGYEYMHISNPNECNWIRDNIEKESAYVFSAEEKKRMFDRLTWSNNFEAFLQKKWTAQKRFGLDGCEVMIPALKELVDRSSELGVEGIVIGMPHRGRLNVLQAVLRKPLEQIFCEFQGFDPTDTELPEGSGDVKYHLGASVDRPVHTGANVHVSLVPNPSHLEAVDPVVLGKARARQHFQGDHEREKTMSLLIHGDAAFSGQGVVYESMAMCNLPDYRTGGTVHVVVNNQVGFTTDPHKSRSTKYCTDLARAIDAPIFHVNADDVEAVCRVSRLAAEYRKQFKKDVVLDLICYRRLGHNEGDEPKFTQPMMYRKIDQHPRVIDQYAQQLLNEGVMTSEDIQNTHKFVNETLQQSFDASREHVAKETDWLGSQWASMLNPRESAGGPVTGVSKDTLLSLKDKLSAVPADFKLHRNIARIMKKKAEMFESGEGFDWGTAESLAFATLLQEGTHVRLSGQDVERGTFSHRHAVMHCQESGDRRTYSPLQNLSDNQAAFSVSNSHLSEFGVLGFEFGYSLENPNSLVLWEAQFGDFFNGAQVIVDQFISSAEAKWNRQSGLCMLLPHGFEGQGPEHSSGRLERFLQMSNDDPDAPFPAEQRVALSNWQVVQCTTPANYFHALRRQVQRQFRKPLICFNPKSLLKYRECVSSIEDFAEGSKFQPVLGDTEVEADKVRKVVLCSGKVYFDLLRHRRETGDNDVALVRVEQLTPFPYEEVAQQVQQFSDEAELVWCQEEPKNMGAFTYVEPRIRTATGKTRQVTYAGRPAAASPATGLGKAVHDAEIAAFLETAYE